MIATCVCRADALSAQGCPVKAQQQLIAKGHDEVKHDLIFTYETVPQSVDATYDFTVITPSGKQLRQHGNKEINVRNPTNNGRHPMVRKFEIEKPVEAGVYTICVVLTKNDSGVGVNMQTLVQNVKVAGKNNKVVTTIPAGFFTGNPAAMTKGEVAQAVYTYYVEKAVD